MKHDTGYFPLFIDLRGKKVLIAGAGKIAARRATVLVEFGADVTVVAPEEGNEFSDRSDKDQQSIGECRIVPVSALAEKELLAWKRRAFAEQDLEQAFLVIAATNNSAVNDEIARLCHERGIPVNHAGDQSQCDFQFPAIVQNDPVVIGINAGGKDHGLVKRVAAGLRKWLAGIDL